MIFGYSNSETGEDLEFYYSSGFSNICLKEYDDSDKVHIQQNILSAIVFSGDTTNENLNKFKPILISRGNNILNHYDCKGFLRAVNPEIRFWVDIKDKIVYMSKNLY